MLPRISRVVAGLAMTFVVVLPVPTSADQRVDPSTLDEATFIRRVAERSPRQRVFEDRRRAATAAVRVAGVLPNPTLSFERESVPELDAHDNFARLGWTLDLAGRRGLASAAARAVAQAEQATIGRDAFVLEIEARLAYLAAAHARDQLAQLDHSRAALLAIVEALQSRAKQGDASSYDAERAGLELDTLDDERASARRSLELARLRLGALIGEPTKAYDPSDPIAIPTRPATGPLTPARAEVQAAFARSRAADRERVAAGRNWVPQLELMIGMIATQSRDGDGLGYVVGIAGDLPLFDRGGPAAARSRAEAKRWQSEAQALSIEATAESEQARRDLLMRIDQAESYAGGPAKRAIDLQRRATVAYREGDRPILELLDVFRAARQTAIRALDLVVDARQAELELRRALGKNQ